MNSEFFCIGHRGCRIDLDENTIVAFNKAIKNGADYIEFDVQKTKDDQLIIIHDTTVERTTNGFGDIVELSSNEISKLRSKINNCQIPLLSELLDELIGQVKFMIELKGHNVCQSVLNLIIEKSILEDCIFSGRNLNQLKLLKKTVPRSKICYNITKGIGLTLTEFLNLEDGLINLSFIDMISLKSEYITPKFIELCHKNDILALSWDFFNNKNPLNRIKTLIDIGIDGILFDNCINIPIIKEWVNKRN